MTSAFEGSNPVLVTTTAMTMVTTHIRISDGSIFCGEEEEEEKAAANLFATQFLTIVVGVVFTTRAELVAAAPSQALFLLHKS
jgi:hypothetical protein